VFISRNKQQSAHTRVILKPTLATVDPSIGTKMYMLTSCYSLYQMKLSSHYSKIFNDPSIDNYINI